MAPPAAVAGAGLNVPPGVTQSLRGQVGAVLQIASQNGGVSGRSRAAGGGQWVCGGLSWGRDSDGKISKFGLVGEGLCEVLRSSLLRGSGAAEGSTFGKCNAIVTTHGNRGLELSEEESESGECVREEEGIDSVSGSNGGDEVEVDGSREISTEIRSVESTVDANRGRSLGYGEDVRQRDQHSQVKEGDMRWNMLLSTEALEDVHLNRASSVTDAHVLRRKGRLKEQDGLIEFIISMHSTHSPFQVMEKLERWMREHLEDPMRSTLSRLIPTVGRFHTPLPLIRAFQDYDEFSSLSRRRYVPPNFAEVRHVLNIAQVHAIAEKLSLITFDADGTIYADGHHIEGDNKMIAHIIKLMQQGVQVAIVTAAGYPGNAAKFEDRLAGLLEAFKRFRLPPAITRLFHVMGGECNYLLRVNDHYRLEFVPDELWMSPDMLQWSESDVEELLTEAECSLRSAAARLRLPIDIIRKPRAVGAVPREATIYEVLEELALAVQVQLMGSRLPFCAFNGGNDVFVDVGNKSVGLQALMRFLHKKPYETLHVGDRFTVSGNDMATRSQCCILWVANPEETAFFTRLLLSDIAVARLHPYLE
ncbi:hypothetical protein M758_2G146800 [Ceratodon purpureus]|nr:hypothetical protein M758_2G146800 [Ceratodon purpureus]